MNDPISWDPSLVKKFSSSNHYKLLNQLRNEVKKYPLNNKKNTTSSQNTVTNLENKDKSNLSYTQNTSFPNNPTQATDANRNQSTVSFNNAKNFSIYNQTANNNDQKNASVLIDQTKTDEDIIFPSFKERLNQIEMK